MPGERPAVVVDEAAQRLLDAARDALAHAHAPYSHYPVGAALITDTGRTFVGCNVENASYPEGVCAETSAISAMVGAGERRIAAIVAVGAGDDQASPCGGCRQRIREFADDDTVIHAAGPSGIHASYRIADLLPDSFGPENLG